MELRECIECWKQKHHFMAYFRETKPQKKDDFISKFLDSHWPASVIFSFCAVIFHRVCTLDCT